MTQADSIDVTAAVYATYYKHADAADEKLSHIERIYRKMTRSRKEESPYDDDLKQAISLAVEAATMVSEARKVYGGFSIPVDRGASFKYSRARRRMHSLDVKLSTLRGRLVRSFGVDQVSLASLAELEGIF